jgi:hypothetical protein
MVSWLWADNYLRKWVPCNLNWTCVIMKGKFKQWWSTTPPISANQTSIPILNYGTHKNVEKYEQYTRLYHDSDEYEQYTRLYHDSDEYEQYTRLYHDSDEYEQCTRLYHDSDEYEQCTRLYHDSDVKDNNENNCQVLWFIKTQNGIVSAVNLHPHLLTVIVNNILLLW